MDGKDKETKEPQNISEFGFHNTKDKVSAPNDKSQITAKLMDLPNSDFRNANECQQCRFAGKCGSEDTFSSGKQETNEPLCWKPISTESLRQNKINKTVENFISNSTCHGFAYCTDKQHSYRRLIWILMVGASVGFLLQKLHQSTTKYFSYPFSTTNTIKYTQHQHFPAVSICNLNDYRMSQLNGTLLYKLLSEKKHSGGSLNLSVISGELYRNTTTRACHRIEHMLVECRMLGEECTYKQFTKFNQKQGECCYTLNGDVYNVATVDKTKPDKTLAFEFNIENYDYYDQKTAGLRLILHDQKETPVSMRGLILPPGFTSFIEIKKLQTINLQKPYKTNCGSLPLQYFPHYSQSACELEELTRFLVKECNCKDQFMPSAVRTCSIQELSNCTWPAWDKFNKMETKCPIACETIHFEPILSFGQYPSNVHADTKSKEFGLTGGIQENRKFIRDNFLRVEIQYESMTYSVMEQTPSYDLMVLLGDIGGQLGLFLGTSILTYMEFFDLIAMIIYTKYFERFTRKEE